MPLRATLVAYYQTKPVASVDSLTGETTAIRLDTGFTDALTQLKLTPGVVGDAELTDGSLVFPITGGNVTYFKPGTVSPHVIGQIQHENSGLSLTAGDAKVFISPVAAELLNQTFKTDAVTERPFEWVLIRCPGMPR